MWCSVRLPLFGVGRSSTTTVGGYTLGRPRPRPRPRARPALLEFGAPPPYKLEHRCFWCSKRTASTVPGKGLWYRRPSANSRAGSDSSLSSQCSAGGGEAGGSEALGGEGGRSCTPHPAEYGLCTQKKSFAIPSGHYYFGSLLLGWQLLKCFRSLQ